MILKKKFDALASAWKRETNHLSNIQTKSVNWNYQRIIGMGEPVVPLILKDFQENGVADWFWALNAIIDDPPTIHKEDAGKMDLMMERWLNWGRKRKLI